MDFDKASHFWTDKEAGSKVAPDAKDRLEKFIEKHKVCALATGAGEYVRCTPIVDLGNCIARRSVEPRR